MLQDSHHIFVAKILHLVAPITRYKYILKNQILKKNNRALVCFDSVRILNTQRHYNPCPSQACDVLQHCISRQGGRHFTVHLYHK